MTDIVAQAAEVEAQAQEAETHAQVAEAAAEATVVAAETAIALAAGTAAVAQQQAAEEVREVVETVRTNEEEISWLRTELAAHRQADATWKESMSAQLTTISEAIALLTVSQSLTPANSEMVEVVEVEETIPAQEPQSASVDVQPEAATPSPQQKRLRRL
jgi:hypothetical protein